jgi:hypothetical protein
LLDLFPDGFKMKPGRVGSRNAWEIDGSASVAMLPEATWRRLESDPKGT